MLLHHVAQQRLRSSRKSDASSIEQSQRERKYQCRNPIVSATVLCGATVIHDNAQHAFSVHAVPSRPAICCASLLGGRASLLDAEYYPSLGAVFNTIRSGARDVHERLASTSAAQPTNHPLPVNYERSARIPIPTTTIPCLSSHTGNYASSTFVAASGADGHRAPVPSGLQQEAYPLSSRPTVRPAPSTCLGELVLASSRDRRIAK